MRAARWAAVVGVVALTATACTGKQERPEPKALQPEVTIASVLPRHGDRRAETDAMGSAIKAVIQARGGKAGVYRIRYVDVDSASPDFGQEMQEGCGALANQLAKDERIVAVIGPLMTACARFLVPGLNQAGVALVTPTQAAPGLTHEVAGPGAQDDASCFACSPAEFYPTGVRNYARVVATEDSEGSAAVDLLVRRGSKRVYILKDADAFDTSWMSTAFIHEASRRHLRVSGPRTYDVNAKSFAPEAQSVVASGSDAVYLMAPTYNSGARLLTAVRDAGFDGTVVSSLSIVDASILKDAPTAVEGAYFTSTRLPLEALPVAARRLAASIRAGEFGVDAVYAAEAADVVLDAVAGSDGTRPGVRRVLFGMSRTGLLGPIAIDANGDVQPQRIAVFQVRNKAFRYRETVTLKPEP